MSNIQEGNQEEGQKVSPFVKAGHPTEKDTSHSSNTTNIASVKEQENIEYLKSMSQCRGEVDDFFIDKSEAQRDNEMS